MIQPLIIDPQMLKNGELLRSVSSATRNVTIFGIPLTAARRWLMQGLGAEHSHRISVIELYGPR